MHSITRALSLSLSLPPSPLSLPLSPLLSLPPSPLSLPLSPRCLSLSLPPSHTCTHSYVGRLKLIAEDFYGVVKQFSEKGKCSITDTEVMQIFLNIQQIHQLNQTILQSLETRIDSW